MINRVVLVGRLTRDPELRKTQSGISNAIFTIACNRTFKQEGQPQSDFINCVAWRSSADFLANYIRKGNLIGIEGRIQTRNYDDANGKKVYITEVVCDSVQALETKSNTNQEPAHTNYGPALPSATDSVYESLEIDSDDLPF